jgi:pimeloyl-ACP methyl ester carboxylesterase
MSDPTIVFVHGAFSSGQNFNYYKTQLAHYSSVVFEYDWNEPTMDVAKTLCGVVESIHGPVVLVGHSLGGNVSVLAAGVYRPTNLVGVITISSPLGGSTAAKWLRQVSRDPVFSHITPRSKHILALQHAHPTVPVDSIVTTRSYAPSFILVAPETDGVVSIRSQTALPYPTYTSISNGHLDVLLSNEAVTLVMGFLQKYKT